jgi:transcriptional pleiotropic regulator of transition state genes
MNTGIIRRLDDLGRIVIPKEVRNRLGIEEPEGIPMSISISDGVITLTPVIEYRCPECKREYMMVEKFCGNCGIKVDKKLWEIGNQGG